MELTDILDEIGRASDLLGALMPAFRGGANEESIDAIVEAIDSRLQAVIDGCNEAQLHRIEDYQNRK
jgi:hypothetical protein